MNIYLVISRFFEAGGTEEPLTTLAIGLKKRGHCVTVFSRDAATAQNQYVRRLLQNHVRVVAWHPLIIKLAGDWQFQDHIVRVLQWTTSPLLAPLALVNALLRSITMRQSWNAVNGRWRGMLARQIDRNRKEELLLAALNWWSLWVRPDIIHIYRSELTSVFEWAARKRIASIYSELSVPGALIEQAIWQQRAQALNKATLVTALSSATADGLRQVVGIKRQIVIIPPVVIEGPKPVNPTTSPNDQVTVTYIGRLSQEKGLSYLLLAAKQVLISRSDVRFLIAGDGELKQPLMEQAQELSITAEVSFYGLFPREDLPKIMAVTDILVLPSISEGMGFVIIEAMAYGKPVVASAVGGIPEVVDHEKTGLLVPPREPGLLAQALSILVNDPEQRKEMGRAGREKFLAGRYTPESFITANLRVYQEALDSFARSGPIEQEYVKG